MESRVNFTAVGAFVALLGVALVGAVLWLGSARSLRADHDTYLVYMGESVTGLNVDAPVRYRGVQVGSVRAIEIARKNIELVRLELAIAEGTPVREDTVAVLRMQGLTGIAHIELTGGSSESPPLRPPPGGGYPVIDTAPSLLVRLDTAVTELLTNFNRTTERVNALLDEENRAQFGRTLANLESITATLAGRSGALDDSMQSASQAMRNAAQVTASLPKLLTSLERSAQAFERAASEAAKAGASANRLIAHADEQAEQFARETLPQARSLLGELREVAVSLRRLSEQLERNPGVLLRGAPRRPLGPGERR